MNMTGFIEAFGKRVMFELEDGTTFFVPDPAGMVLLKLSAWNDLYPTNKATKHVRDIGLLVEAFFEGTVDQIDTAPAFSGIFDLLPHPQIVYHSAVVIGRQIKHLCEEHPETLILLQSIFNKIKDDERQLFMTPFEHELTYDTATARQTIRYLFEAILTE